jgi:hypothetical protein
MNPYFCIGILAVFLVLVILCSVLYLAWGLWHRYCGRRDVAVCAVIVALSLVLLYLLMGVH